MIIIIAIIIQTTSMVIVLIIPIIIRILIQIVIIAIIIIVVTLRMLSMIGQPRWNSRKRTMGAFGGRTTVKLWSARLPTW